MDKLVRDRYGAVMSETDDSLFRMTCVTSRRITIQPEDVFNDLIDLMREQFKKHAGDRARQATHLAVDRGTWGRVDRELFMSCNPWISCMHIVDSDDSVGIAYRPAT